MFCLSDKDFGGAVEDESADAEWENRPVDENGAYCKISKLKELYDK